MWPSIFINPSHQHFLASLKLILGNKMSGLVHLDKRKIAPGLLHAHVDTVFVPRETRSFSELRGVDPVEFVQHVFYRRCVGDQIILSTVNQNMNSKYYKLKNLTWLTISKYLGANTQNSLCNPP